KNLRNLNLFVKFIYLRRLTNGVGFDLGKKRALLHAVLVSKAGENGGNSAKVAQDTSRGHQIFPVTPT
ncbi:MAG: hypothetical protein WCP45_12510, partial [Verrucomicrobiota bacterium]